MIFINTQITVFILLIADYLLESINTGRVNFAYGGVVGNLTPNYVSTSTDMSNVELLLMQLVKNQEAEKNRVYKAVISETEITRAQTTQQLREQRSSW